MIKQKIASSSTIKYIIASEIRISVQDLTEDEILKLNKPELQIALKEMRRLLLTERDRTSDLSSLIGNYDSMAELLEKNGYNVTYNQEKE